MKKLLLFLFVCFSSLKIYAQSSETLKKINLLKRDTTNIYADVTKKYLEEALDDATAIFKKKITEWARKEIAEECLEECLEKAKSNRTEIFTKHGRLNRVFIYVSKKDIRVSYTEIAPPEEEPEIIYDKNSLNEDELEMTTITQFEQIEPYIKRMKANRKVKAYGKYKSMPTNELCYLFIYNWAGEVVAVLKKTSDSTVNLRNREFENIHNYTNCGAIWFQFNE